MENRKRPGFTLLETVISISFISLFLVLIIYIPVQLVSEYKNFDDKISNTESVINVFRSFRKTYLTKMEKQSLMETV